MNVLVDGQVFSSPELNRGIGVYTRNVLINMIEKSSIDDNWFITIDDRNALDCLPNEVSCRLITIVNEAFMPTTDHTRCELYTEKLEGVINRYGIDVYWNPDPLMVNVLFPKRKLNCKMILTIYDLIPYIKPIDEWAPSIKDEYNRRIDFIKKEDIIGVCISKATENDVHSLLGEHIKTNVTMLAADEQIFYKETERDIENPYIVFTGGFDYRKNIFAAVEAYQMALDENLSSDFAKTKFYLVCKCSDEQKEYFYSKIKPEYREKVVLTGFIPDDELASLYTRASVFFFPSLYEGFGLPILEAMLGGAYILSADNSSLPEVCGDFAMLCNAEDVADMSKKLVKAYDASAKETIEDRKKRQEYALGYSWKKTANETYMIFKSSIPPMNYGKRYKIAMITPWPSMKTGIANYIYKLVPALNEYMDVDIFVDNTHLEEPTVYLDYKYGNLFNICELPYRYKDYDQIVYQIGNNTQFHTGIYESLCKIGGIAEIHDYNLSAFFYHSFYINGKKEVMRSALIDGYGKMGEKYYDYIEDGHNYDGRFHMNEAVASQANALIYHNAWSIVQKSISKRDYCIPLACFEEKIIDYSKIEEKVKSRIKYDGEELIIGVLGFVNGNKRYSVILKAFSRLLTTQEKLKLVFWGKEASEDIFDIIQKEGLSDHVIVTGYLEDNEYELGLDMTDIIINLRYPSMGESSATLSDAFMHKKPVIVSALNQYLEFPDSTCWKLPVYDNEEYEAEHLCWMLQRLVNDEDLREKMGDNAQKYAKRNLSLDMIAKKYYEVISRESNR